MLNQQKKKERETTVLNAVPALPGYVTALASSNVKAELSVDEFQCTERFSNQTQSGGVWVLVSGGCTYMCPVLGKPVVQLKGMTRRDGLPAP